MLKRLSLIFLFALTIPIRVLLTTYPPANAAEIEHFAATTPQSTPSAIKSKVATQLHVARLQNKASLYSPIEINIETDGVVANPFDPAQIDLRYKLTATMAQLAFLHVTKAYRRQGVSRRLLAEVIQLAKADGATELYVSATPSGSAVGFYTAQGFVLTQQPNPELFGLEPEDIRMIKRLA